MSDPYRPQSPAGISPPPPALVLEDGAELAFWERVYVAAASRQPNMISSYPPIPTRFPTAARLLPEVIYPQAEADQAVLLRRERLSGNRRSRD